MKTKEQQKARYTSEGVFLSPTCYTHYMLTQMGVVNCLPRTERGTRKGEQTTKKTTE